MNTKLLYVVRILLLWLSVLCIAVSNLGADEPKADFYPCDSVQTFGGTDALQRGQGITTDGEFFYYSSNYGFLKTELDGKTWVCAVLKAIPDELWDRGCDHIGGITTANGRIYAPIEDSRVFENLYIAVYDCNTLELIEYKAVPLDKHENGIPWVAADEENGLLYSARCDNIEELNIYSLDTLELIGTLPVSMPVDNIQGGDIYNGTLYVSVSRQDQGIYAVDLGTGNTEKIISRNLADGAEGEDMTVLPMDDGTVFHILDIAEVRTAVHLRHYKYNSEK